jgi:hypothetical protein
MPLWKVFHGSDTLKSQADKEAIAKGATQFYVKNGLPAFYVNVIFIPVTPDNFFTGGVEKSKTVGIEIDHVARHWDPIDKATSGAVKDGIDAIMRPYTIDRGFHLEYAILEGPVGLWRINGIDPPESFGPDEQAEAERNRKILNEKYGP